jgi:hypothetical protein
MGIKIEQLLEGDYVLFPFSSYPSGIIIKIARGRIHSDIIDLSVLTNENTISRPSFGGLYTLHCDVIRNGKLLEE